MKQLKYIFEHKIQYVLVSAFVVTLLFSCSKSNSSTPAGPTGPPTFTATVNKQSRTFTVLSVKYNGSLFTMNLASDGKPDTVLVNLNVTATQYGTFTLASNKSPNFGSLMIVDHADTLYYTDNTHLGYVQLTSFNTTSGSHVASGSFKFTCNETSPIAGGGIDSASGTFSNLTW
jgi:hypothetical protein